MTKLEAAQKMLTWLAQEGGYVHPSVEVRDDPESGLGVYATTEIEKDERLISCPFSLAITPALATAAITAVTGVDESDLIMDVVGGKPWNERMRVAAYIGLHWVQADKKDAEWPAALAHKPYVDALPPADQLTTPHYFSKSEKELLAGTNLQGAVETQDAEWRKEAAVVSSVLKEEGLTWDRYLAVATYLTSRAFPSALLRLPNGETKTSSSETETEVGAEAESHPVLLPGLDMLNHARGQPILWLSSRIPPPSSTPNADAVPAISFVAPEPIQGQAQVFNNYGAKSNESLLLGYGFVIPSNPDDTVVLQLGGVPSHIAKRVAAKGLEAGKRFTVGRDGELPRELVEVVRIMMADDGEDAEDCGCGHEHDHGHGHGHEAGHGHVKGDDEDDEEEEDEHAAHEKEVAEFEHELDVLGMLGGMLEDKLERLEARPDPAEDVRQEIVDMADTYRVGQMEILSAALDKLGERVERVEGLLAEGPECPCGC